MQKMLTIAIFMLGLPSITVADDIMALSARLKEVQYPYPVKYMKLYNQKQMLEMAYMDIQPKNPNGKTVLLLHGKNFNGSYWHGTVEQLNKAGYRVIVPDQIGFGKSSKPAAFQYTFQQLAMNTHELLNYLGINKAVVVGHSIGGMLAIRFALMFPDQTEALVLEDPIGLEDWRLYIPYHSVDQIYAAEMKQTLESIKQYQQSSYYHGTWKPEYDQGLKLQYGWVKGPDYPLIAWTSALTTDMAFTQPVLYELPKLRVPTLLIIGELDRTVLTKSWAPANVKDKLGNYPVLGKKAAAAIPYSKLIMISGTGHIPHIEKPEAFYAALLPFIQSH